MQRNPDGDSYEPAVRLGPGGDYVRDWPEPDADAELDALIQADVAARRRRAGAIVAEQIRRDRQRDIEQQQSGSAVGVLIVLGFYLGLAIGIFIGAVFLSGGGQ